MQIEIHIDKAGRIVIPKEIREEWGVSPDRPFIMENKPDGIMLRPKQEAQMVQRNGIWVYHVPNSRGKDIDIVQLIDAVRSERL